MEIGRLLAHEMGKDIEPIIVGKYRQGDIRHCFADISRAKRILQWKPSKTFREGVPELMEWVTGQPRAQDSIDTAWRELEQRGLFS
jgi:dTDP-L-rhamnose 4-epimerase